MLLASISRDDRIVLDGADSESRRELEYDHVVFALGAVSNYLGLANVEKLAFDFKTLLDAIRIRNHVIEMFERADRETDPVMRRQLLTFVIAGGGFAGVELAGALNDFAHGIFPDYRNLNIEELCVTLVHSRDRILPELSETLAGYALKKMKERGVVFRLGTRLVDAQPGLVTLSDGQISAETLVWTAGTAPNPLIRDSGSADQPSWRNRSRQHPCGCEALDCLGARRLCRGDRFRNQKTLPTHSSICPS